MPNYSEIIKRRILINSIKLNRNNPAVILVAERRKKLIHLFGKNSDHAQKTSCHINSFEEL